MFIMSGGSIFKQSRRLGDRSKNLMTPLINENFKANQEMGGKKSFCSLHYWQIDKNRPLPFLDISKDTLEENSTRQNNAKPGI